MEGCKFARQLSHGALSALLFEANNELFSWKAHDPVELRFVLMRENDHSFNVSIQAEFTLYSSCVRCLETMGHRFFLDFSILMLDGNHFGEKDEPGAIWQFDSEEVDISSDEELSVGYFTDHCIDLGVILRDQIFYEAPDYPHCADENGSIACQTAIKNTDNDIATASFSPFAKLKTR